MIPIVQAPSPWRPIRHHDVDIDEDTGIDKTLIMFVILKYMLYWISVFSNDI